MHCYVLTVEHRTHFTAVLLQGVTSIWASFMTAAVICGKTCTAVTNTPEMCPQLMHRKKLTIDRQTEHVTLTLLNFEWYLALICSQDKNKFSAALLAPSPPSHPAPVCALSAFCVPENELHELRGHRLHDWRLCMQLRGDTAHRQVGLATCHPPRH